MLLSLAQRLLVKSQYWMENKRILARRPQPRVPAPQDIMPVGNVL